MASSGCTRCQRLLYSRCWGTVVADLPFSCRTGLSLVSSCCGRSCIHRLLKTLTRHAGPGMELQTSWHRQAEYGVRCKLFIFGQGCFAVSCMCCPGVDPASTQREVGASVHAINSDCAASFMPLLVYGTCRSTMLWALPTSIWRRMNWQWSTTGRL